MDTASVPNTWVTEHVALITQEVHLFSGTLRDDLLLVQADFVQRRPQLGVGGAGEGEEEVVAKRAENR